MKTSTQIGIIKNHFASIRWRAFFLAAFIKLDLSQKEAAKWVY